MIFGSAKQCFCGPPWKRLMSYLFNFSLLSLLLIYIFWSDLYNAVVNFSDSFTTTLNNIPQIQDVSEDVRYCFCLFLGESYLAELFCQKIEEGNVKGHPYFCTSGRRSSWSAFGRWSGNDISGHYKRHYFFPLLSSFLIEGVLGSNNLFGES